MQLGRRLEVFRRQGHAPGELLGAGQGLQDAHAGRAGEEKARQRLVKVGAEQLKAARAVIDGGLSVRKTEQLAAKTVKKLTEEPETESKTDALMVDYIAETEDYLSRSLARKVALEQKRKGGRIILEFYDSDDREALISNLARMGRSWEEIIK